MLIIKSMRTLRPLQLLGRGYGLLPRTKTWSLGLRRGFSDQARDSASSARPNVLAYAAVAGAGAAGLWLLLKTADENGLATSILDQQRLPVVRYATLSNMEKAVDEIRKTIPDNEDIISTDDEDLRAHGYSEWTTVHVDTLPVAVAYPMSTEDVSAIARVCHKWKVPVIPYSGGSSVEGHTSAPFGGVSVDFLHMNQILAFNENDMDMVVQPGLNWADMNEELKRRGSRLFFPMDPGPTAKIGGMVATNCSGTNVVRYGTMRDWVVNLTVVLADGTVVKTRRRPRKSSAGYNLNGIIIGSEGTLGIVTEATLKLAVIPEHFSVAVVPFKDVRAAVAAASKVIQSGVPVAAVELMDASLMRMVNASGVTRPRVWKETPTLFFKFSGTKVSVADNIESTKAIVSAAGGQGFEYAVDEKEQKLLWSARKESLLSILALRDEGEELWNTDVAVPLGQLADIIDKSHEDAQRLGLNVYIKGHVGDGNFHENIRYRKDVHESHAKAQASVKDMVTRALEAEGTCTGEHGVGYGKKAALATEIGEDTLVVMKLIKGILDPNWILNPGKVFDR